MYTTIRKCVEKKIFATDVAKTDEYLKIACETIHQA